MAVVHMEEWESVVMHGLVWARESESKQKVSVIKEQMTQLINV